MNANASTYDYFCSEDRLHVSALTWIDYGMFCLLKLRFKDASGCVATGCGERKQDFSVPDIPKLVD